MAKVLLIIPTTGGVHAMTAMAAHQLGMRPDCTWQCIAGRPHDYARNCAVRHFLAQLEFTHLFFLDSDVEPPLDALERLLALEAPIATGCYGVGRPHWALAEYREGHFHLLKALPERERPFAVAGCGAGCLLIRREVLEKIAWPWFRWVERPDGSQVGEDIYFSAKANEAGYAIRAHPGVICGHYKDGVNITALLPEGGIRP